MSWCAESLHKEQELTATSGTARAKFPQRHPRLRWRGPSSRMGSIGFIDKKQVADLVYPSALTADCSGT